MLRHYRKRNESNINLHFMDQDETHAVFALENAVQAYGELMDYFDVTDDLPGINIVLVPNRDEFDRLVADMLQVNIEKPSDPRRVAQPQRTDIVFISPSAYNDHSSYNYNEEDFKRMIKHELVHVFEEFLTPDMEVSPGWWSEGLSVYLSDQWKYKSQFEFCEPVISALEKDEIPQVEDVLSKPIYAYTFGWTIVMYLERTFGKSFVDKMVRSLNESDLLKFADIDKKLLQMSWSKWLKASKLEFK